MHHLAAYTGCQTSVSGCSFAFMTLCQLRFLFGLAHVMVKHVVSAMQTDFTCIRLRQSDQ